MSDPGAGGQAGELPAAAEAARWGAPVAIALAGLALADAALLSDAVRTIPVIVSKNFNEGWNALHAANVFGPRPLYPPPDALVGNNYPPLSYYLLALLGPLFGDHVVAGRVVALASLGVVAANVGRIAARLGASAPASSAAALLFLGGVAAHFENYVAMNDPQWLGHALMTTGLAILLGGPERKRRVALAAAVMVAAGLVKHILVPIPAAAAIWLALHHRRSLAAFAASGAAALALASAALLAAHGRDMIVDVFGLGRSFQPQTLGPKLAEWLTPFAAPIAVAGLACVLDRADAARRVLHLYLALSLLVLLGTAAGVAVNYNAAFDFVIASYACAGLALDRLARALAAGARLAFPAARALAFASLAVTVLLALGQWANGPDRMQRIAREAREFAADLEWVRAARGPVGCTTPALCYWAGRPTAIDVFKTAQLHAAGRLPPRALAARIEDEGWEVFQVGGPQGLPAEVRELLEREFRVARRSSANGLLYVRRRAP